MSAKPAAVAAELREAAPQLNIYQRINEVRKNVGYIRRDAEVQGYTAVSHDAVTAALRNNLIEQGIGIVPTLKESSVETIGQTKNGAPIIRYQARYKVGFINADNPWDFISMDVEAHANDHGDKAPGKALSYATKYAMLKMFSLETGEEDEGRVEPYIDRNKKITEKQQSVLCDLLAAAEADEGKFLTWINAESIDAIPLGKFDQARVQLERKVQARSREDSHAGS